MIKEDLIFFMAMSKKEKLWLMIFLGMMTAIAPLATDMYLPSLPIMQTELGITASLAQMTLTMTLFGMASGQIFMGPISDRYGRKLPLFAGMMVFLLANAGCFLAQDIKIFLFFRFLTGFAGASGIVIARSIARDVCEGSELTRFFAMLMMVNGLAPIIAPVLGGQLLLIASWRSVFALLIVVGVLLALATLIYQETLPKVKRFKGLADSFKKYPELLQNRYFLGHCLMQCFYFGAFFSYLAGSSFVFQNIYEVSPQTYSFIFGTIGIGLMLSGMVPARLAGKVADVKILKGALMVPLLSAVFMLAGFMLAAPLWYTIIILFITIVPLSVMGTASFSLALSRQGKNAGSASALIGFFSMILGGCMMPVVGIAGDHTAIPMGIIMLSGYILSFICFKLMIAPEHQYQ